MTVVLLAVLVAVACRPGDAAVAVVGRPAPAYAAASLSGEATSLAALRGNVVLLNAWATWCKPCLEEIPEFHALDVKYRARGLTVIGVSLDEDTATAPIRAFIKQHEMTYAVWHDPQQRLMSAFNFGGLPTTMLIDRDGVLRWMSTGKITPGDTALDAAVLRLLR